jgi:hypothetical protein
MNQSTIYSSSAHTVVAELFNLFSLAANSEPSEDSAVYINLRGGASYLTPAVYIYRTDTLDESLLRGELVAHLEESDFSTYDLLHVYYDDYSNQLIVQLIRTAR